MRRYFSESGVPIPRGLWAMLRRAAQAMQGRVIEAASAASQAPVVRRGARRVTQARLVSDDFGARDASPSVARLVDADDVPMDSFKSDLERKKSLRQVMPARTGILDDLMGDTSQCVDRDTGEPVDCDDDNAISRDDYERTEAEGRDPRKAMRALGTEPSAAERTYANEMAAAEGRDGKERKEDVNYRYSPDLAKTCGGCRFFVEPGSCKRVEGLIRTIDVCDLWQADRSKGARSTFTDEYKK